MHILEIITKYKQKYSASHQSREDSDQVPHVAAQSTLQVLTVDEQLQVVGNSPCFKGSLYINQP